MSILSLPLPLVGELCSAQRLRRRRRHRLCVRISSTSTTSAALASTLISPVVTLTLVVRRSDLEARHVNSASISQRVLGKTVGMHFQLMRLEIHLRIKHDEFLL